MTRDAPPIAREAIALSVRMTASGKSHQPQKLRRNERERRRVHQVNLGFNSLRDRVPRPAGTKHKLSKVETLREAARYIEHLRAILAETQGSMSCQSSPSYCFPTNSSAPTSSSYNSMSHSNSAPSYYSSDSSFDEMPPYFQ